MHNNLDDELQQLVMDCSLCAANTWHARPWTTYTTTSTSSQIDYALLRLADANHCVKQARPLHQFPVAADRHVNHHPIQVELPLLPAAHRFHQRQQAKPQFDLQALQYAVGTSSPAAETLREAISARIQACPASLDLNLMHRRVNDILLDETCKHFPLEPRADNRISANPQFRASAKETWRLHAMLQRPGPATLRDIWSRWRLVAAFFRASKALRKQSLQLKKAFLNDQLLQAEQAAAKGDHRNLFLIARRLGPRPCKDVCRLKGEDGHVLNGPEEMQAILKYSKATFAALPDNIPMQPSTGALDIKADDLEHELAHLHLRKAVPQGTAPNACWKLCARAVSRCIGPCLQRHFAANSTAKLEGELQDAQIAWIPKPSKPPTSVESLRPIGLMPPCAKSIAGILAKQILVHLQPLLDHLPQFAYTAGRSCGDAALRVHEHFVQVETLQRSQADNRFRKRFGSPALACFGGMCLSLDLSKAFDGVCREALVQSLIQHNIPSDIINAVQQLHRGAKYICRTSSAEGQVCTSNGIKQG